jgi:hypothetical protein
LAPWDRMTTKLAEPADGDEPISVPAGKAVRK